MKSALILLFTLHQECLSISWNHDYEEQSAYGNQDSQGDHFIDDKYRHPYIVDGRNFKYYLDLGVQNGEITQEEMDEEIAKAYASSVLDRRADISDQFHKVNYFFSSRQQSSNIKLRRASRNQQGWIYGQQVKIIIHGWTSTKAKLTYWDKIDSQKIWAIQRAYISNYNYNVIVVDWTYFSSTGRLLYLKAATNAVKVAEEVADFVQDLQAKGLVSSLDQIHIIGHSLGAQVAGRVGYHVQKNGAGKIGRITGSDPAGPAFAYRFVEIIPGLFSGQGSFPGDLTYAHVSKQDATFVDIIHCNQGKIVLGKYGSDRKAGHADFLVNSGSNQPPCSFTDDYFACSHRKCQVHFLNSITRTKKACRKESKKNCPIWNFKCWKLFRRNNVPNIFISPYDYGYEEANSRSMGLMGRARNGDCAIFGERCQRNARGTYYIDL